MRYSLSYPALLAVVLAECGGRPSRTAPVVLLPCSIPGVGTPDSVWHQVRASGFTFCVPPAWRPAAHVDDGINAKQWHGDGGMLTWDLGRPRSLTGPDVTLKVTVPVVVGTNPRPVPETSHLCSPRKTTPLTLEGGILLVTELECQQQWTITAWSTAPAIYVQSEGNSDRVVPLLRRIMDTIRFTTSAR